MTDQKDLYIYKSINKRLKLIFVCLYSFYFLVQVEQVWLLPFIFLGDCGA